MLSNHRFGLFCITLTLCWTVSCQGNGSPESSRPNILLAIADDWSWPHAGAYGDSVVETPNFDRVAEEGILYRNAYVSSPSCTPSRAAILTGQWHWRLRESANLWSTLSREIPVYPDLLEADGYHVGYSGKGWGPGRVEVGGRTRNPAGTEYPSFDAFISKRRDRQPFCFWFGSLDPHRAYDEGSGVAAGIAAEKIELSSSFPDSPQVRSDVADYYLEVERFDRQVGEILRRIDHLGELDNTLVVITSDNGMPFPRCKGNLYDGGVRVPLAIRWGKKFSGGQVIDHFVSLTDLAPTFLAAVGLFPPEMMTGRSLQEVVNPGGIVPDPPVRTAVLFGKERHVPSQEREDSGGTPMRGIRTVDYLYVRNFRPDRWPAGTPNWKAAYFEGSWYGDVDNGPTKTYMIENRSRDPEHIKFFGLAFDKRPAEELYDLRTDPGQLNNVAEDEAYQEIKRQLSAELLDALIRSGDPRASGGKVDFDQFPYYGGSPQHPDFK